MAVSKLKTKYSFPPVRLFRGSMNTKCLQVNLIHYSAKTFKL